MRAEEREIDNEYSEVGANNPQAVSYGEARERLRIDKNALDDEVSRHADWYNRVCERCAMVCSQRDGQKHLVAQVEAEIAYNLRQGYMQRGDRVTEAMLKEEVAAHPDLDKVNKAYLRLRREADLWQGMRDAWEQRGRMLRDLTQLYIAGYYALSSSGGTLNSFKDEAAARARKGMAQYRGRPQLNSKVD